MAKKPLEIMVAELLSPYQNIEKASFFLFYLFILVKKNKEEAFFGVNLVFDVTWITQSFIDSKKVQ